MSGLDIFGDTRIRRVVAAMECRCSNAAKRLLWCIAPLLTLSSCADQAVPPLAACPTGLQPLPPLPVPKPPVGESLQYTGAVRLRFVIDPAGRVHSPVIVSDALQPTGRHRGEVTGHREAALATVARFRYPTRTTPCRMEMPFEFTLDDGSDEAQNSATAEIP
jgi:hypothetical protein